MRRFLVRDACVPTHPLYSLEDLMKKFVALLLALALVTPFSIGCGDKKDDKKPAAGGDKGDTPPATPGDQEPKGE